MKFTKLAATMLCSVLLLCGCTKSTDVVLKVNDTEITRGEFYGDFDKLKESQLKEMPKASSMETKFMTLSLKQRFLNDMITKALLKEEFERKKLEASQDEIKAKEKSIIDKVGSKEDFENILKENKISKERLNEDLATEVKIDKLVAQIAPKTATDKDALDYYNKNKEQFKAEETVHAYHILFNTNPEEIKRKIVDADKNAELSSTNIDEKVKEETAKQQALVNEVYAKASKNPKDFGKLAKQYSQDPGSKDKGGDLGYVQRRTLVKEFGDVAFTQKKGSVARAKTQFGEHIIYVTDKKPAGVLQFSEVKENLKLALTQDLKTTAFRNLVQGLKKNAKIEYVDENLNPEKLQKQLQETQQKLIEAQQKKYIPDSKMKTLNKLEEKEKAQRNSQQ